MLDQDKITKLEEQLEAIQNKTASIMSQTAYLKIFNRKMRILLTCFNAYAIDDFEELNENIKIEEKETKAEQVKESSRSTSNSIETHNKKVKLSKDLILERISSIGANEKPLAENILELITTNESIGLDDVVKSIKTSKYKIINVINTLIKEKIIIKSYEKGFVYRINKEQ